MYHDSRIREYLIFQSNEIFASSLFSYVKMLIFHTVVAVSAFESLIIFHVISHGAQDKRYVYFCLLHFKRYLKKTLLREWLGKDLILLLEKCIIWSTHHLKTKKFLQDLHGVLMIQKKRYITYLTGDPYSSTMFACQHMCKLLFDSFFRKIANPITW